MSDIECPYCGEEQDINHDDGYGYEEGEFYTQECNYCEKTFVYHTSIIYHYEANRADCQNGAEHNYRPVHIAPKFWGYGVYECADCGARKTDYVERLILLRKNIDNPDNSHYRDEMFDCIRLLDYRLSDEKNKTNENTE